MSVSSHHSETPVEEKQPGLESPEVCTKYTTAGEIANKVLQLVINASVADADIYDICKIGDDAIVDLTGKCYNKKDKDGKKIEKGIGFPTCISVNELGGNFSPLKGESKTLRSGDVVKIELGVHIDGYIAEAGHTILIPHSPSDSPSEKTSALDDKGRICDRRADVIAAAWTAAETALRTMQVGNKNTQVTDVLRDSSNAYKCQPVNGVLSHSISKYVIDGPNVIVSKESSDDASHQQEHTFEVNSAYTLDIRMSTGDGKLRENGDVRHTLYKRAHETTYILKTQKARQFISEVKKKFPSLPFSLRNFEDEQCARVGVSEANRHKLLHEYPVMNERVGEYVACFKFTVLLLSGGVKKISGLNFAQEDVMESTHQLPEELKALLAKSAAPRKKRNKKTKGDAAPAAEGAEGEKVEEKTEEKA